MDRKILTLGLLLDRGLVWFGIWYTFFGGDDPILTFGWTQEEDQVGHGENDHRAVEEGK